jgi:quercetin dioxygenase-like cupin family protein
MPLPGSTDDGTMAAELAHFDFAQELAAFQSQKPWPSGIHAKTLFKRPDFRTILVCMEAAATIKEHHADGTSSVQVLKGAIRYKTQGKTYELKTGTLLTLGACIKHDLEAIEESAFLLTIAWPNNEALLAMPHRGYGT